MLRMLSEGKSRYAALVAGVLVVFALAFGLVGCTGGHDSGNAANANAANAAASVNAGSDSGKSNGSSDSKQGTSNLKFRSYSLMKSHYEKHGIDMGFKSMEDYLAAANAVVANPKSLHKNEKEDGDDVYFLEKTGEIVFVSTDGYIRTYFIPDSGKRYFDKQ